MSPFAGGSFGTVYKAIDKTDGEIVAIKHVRRLIPSDLIVPN
jgi:serine/threonine protein kinase